MKGLLTIACNTFLRQGKLFPTSVASVWVTKSIILSQKVQKTNVRLLSDCTISRLMLTVKDRAKPVVWGQNPGIRKKPKEHTSPNNTDTGPILYPNPLTPTLFQLRMRQRGDCVLLCVVRFCEHTHISQHFLGTAVIDKINIAPASRII